MKYFFVCKLSDLEPCLPQQPDDFGQTRAHGILVLGPDLVPKLCSPWIPDRRIRG